MRGVKGPNPHGRHGTVTTFGVIFRLSPRNKHPDPQNQPPALEFDGIGDVPVDVTGSEDNPIIVRQFLHPAPPPPSPPPFLAPWYAPTVVDPIRLEVGDGSEGGWGCIGGMYQMKGLTNRLPWARRLDTHRPLHGSGRHRRPVTAIDGTGAAIQACASAANVVALSASRLQPRGHAQWASFGMVGGRGTPDLAVSPGAGPTRRVRGAGLGST